MTTKSHHAAQPFELVSLLGPCRNSWKRYQKQARTNQAQRDPSTFLERSNLGSRQKLSFGRERLSHLLFSQNSQSRRSTMAERARLLPQRRLHRKRAPLPSARRHRSVHLACRHRRHSRRADPPRSRGRSLSARLTWPNFVAAPASPLCMGARIMAPPGR